MYAKTVMNDTFTPDKLAVVGDIDQPTGIMRSILAANPAWDGSGKWALGAPDGFPAIIKGERGQTLELALFDKPKKVSSLTIHLMSLYGRGIDGFLNVYGLTSGGWVLLASNVGSVPGDTAVIQVPVGKEIGAVRFTQAIAGTDAAIDSVEAEQPFSLGKAVLATGGIIAGIAVITAILRRRH